MLKAKYLAILVLMAASLVGVDGVRAYSSSVRDVHQSTGFLSGQEQSVLQVTSLTVMGPAAINLSDTSGRYMWALGQIVNNSTEVEQVSIEFDVSPDLGTIAGCQAHTPMVLPGQTVFNMLPGESKFVIKRGRFECHSPATAQVVQMTISLAISPSAGGNTDSLVVQKGVLIQ